MRIGRGKGRPGAPSGLPQRSRQGSLLDSSCGSDERAACRLVSPARRRPAAPNRVRVAQHPARRRSRQQSRPPLTRGVLDPSLTADTFAAGASTSVLSLQLCDRRCWERTHYHAAPRSATTTRSTFQRARASAGIETWPRPPCWFGGANGRLPGPAGGRFLRLRSAAGSWGRQAENAMSRRCPEASDDATPARCFGRDEKPTIEPTNPSRGVPLRLEVIRDGPSVRSVSIRTGPR
jgi:hypothetical protein